jgi:type II secretory pathway pseudopilin PulG
MRRRQESGFALLLVFLMAAAIAISLYMEIPRVAFESQRQKEQLLVSRGEQYKRAIQMFMKANNRWPAKIEDLESFNNRRFLRKRFTDPMTGKDEWRFIHIQNGILIDSVTNKQKGVAGSTGSQSQLVGEMPATAADIAPGTQGANPAMRRRASDGMTPGVGGPGEGVADPNNPQNLQNLQPLGFPNGQPYAPGALQPGQTYPPGVTPRPGQTYPPGFIPPPGVPIPGQPGVYPYTGQPQQYPGQPVQYPGQPVQYPGQPVQYPGQPVPYPGQPVQYPGQPIPYPGQPGQYPGQIVQYPGLPGQPVNSQAGGVSPTPYPTYPGANGPQPTYPQPGLNPQPGSNAATQMIQQILTSPRPGGMPSNAGQAAMGAGIAGVASNADSEGIMVYNDRTNYKEWEFIYDPTKVRPIPNPLTGAPGTPASQMGTPASQLGSTPGQQPGCVPTDPFSGGTCSPVPAGFGPTPGARGPVTIPPVMNPVVR